MELVNYCFDSRYADIMSSRSGVYPREAFHRLVVFLSSEQLNLIWSESLVSWIPDSKLQQDSGFLVLDSGFHKQNIPGFRNPDSLTWGDSVVVAVVTVAWQITFDWRHFPSSGQCGLFLQLQLSGYCVGELKFERTYLLCEEMTDFILGMHEQLSFSVCLLKILWSGWFFWKAFVDDVQKFSTKVSSEV